MWQVLLISLVTSSVAFTTHRYDAYDSFGNYHPNAPLLDSILKWQNSNGRRPVQTYEYIKRYDGVVISDVYEVPVVSSDGDHGRVVLPSNPYQWNRQVPWNRVVVVTEPVKIYKRFDNPDTKNTEPFVQKDKKEDVETNQRKPSNEFNTPGNVSVANKQFNDINHTLVINEQQITWNNDQDTSEDNANITTRSINSDNNSNTLNASTKHSDNDNFNYPTESNADKVSENDNSSHEPSNKYSTKTTQDNEVTPRPHEPRTKAYEEDRWIWSDGKEQVVETTTTMVDTTVANTTVGNTTLVGVDDRASFKGSECPQGWQKLGDICVMKD